MKLKVKKLHKDARIPEYAHTGDAGADLFALENDCIRKGQIKLIRTGIAIELPKNTEAQVRPRSGLALKQGITVLNTPGTIDEEYRGEIGVILINHGKDNFEIRHGMKIAQLIVKPVVRVKIEEVKELSNTSRGHGGFGSTGS